MRALRTGLTGAQAKAQAKALAKGRAQMLRERDRAALQAIRSKIATARARRKKALKQATKSCARARVAVRAAVREYKENERARLRAEVAAMRGAARNRCQARKYKIRVSGAGLVQQRALQLREERRLQQQLERLGKAADLKHKRLTTAKERREEDDDAVRSNLPPELVGVFNVVRKSIKAGPRTTRTEAFLEWAAENPGDVLFHQQNAAERDVRRLVLEQERLGQKLAKTKAYAPSSDELDRLTKMGLDPSSTAARRRATSSMRDWVPF